MTLYIFNMCTFAVNQILVICLLPVKYKVSIFPDISVTANFQFSLGMTENDAYTYIYIMSTLFNCTASKFNVSTIELYYYINY